MEKIIQFAVQINAVRSSDGELTVIVTAPNGQALHVSHSYDSLSDFFSQLETTVSASSEAK